MGALGVLSILLVSGLAPTAPTPQPTPSTLSCAGARVVEARLPSGSPPANVQIEVTTPTWMELAEEGVDVEVRNDGKPLVFQTEQPPRFGRAFVEMSAHGRLTVGRETPHGEGGLLTLTLHCGSDPTIRAQIDWLQQAAKVSPRGYATIAPADADQRLQELSRLRTIAKSPWMRALSLHLTAQTNLLAGRSVAASTAFANAEAAWMALGDHDRAQAARVGRVEDALRAGDYRLVLELTGPNVQTAKRSYFGTRLAASRCLALRYLGQLAKADDCYRISIESLRSLDERQEIAVLLLDRAYVKQILSQPEDAELLARQAADGAEGPGATIQQGRAHLAIAEARLARADIVASLEEMKRALSSFETAGHKRWTAVAMLRVAALYESLGALAEARSFADLALRQLSPTDAPARVASALAQRAETEIHSGQARLAVATLLEAERLYASLNMPIEVDGVRANLAIASLDLRDLSRANSLVSGRDRQVTGSLSKWRLAAARLALLQGRHAEATTQLVAARKLDLALPARVEAARLESLVDFAEGKRDSAHRRLSLAARQIDDLLMRVTNPLLRSVLARQIEPLRRTAARLILADIGQGTTPNASRVSLARTWAWLQMGNGSLPPTAQVTSDNREVVDFDRAVARELMPSPSMQGGSQAASRHLLDVLASQQATPGTTNPQAVELGSLQAKLPKNALFLGYLDAEERGLLLYVTQSTAAVVSAPDTKTLQQSAQNLTSLLSRRNSSLPAIENEAAILSTLILDPLKGQTQPDLLMVHRDGALANVPWPAVTWPGEGTALVSRTAIKLVGAAASSRRLELGAPTIKILISATEASKLGGLATALTEPELIESAMKRGSIGIVRNARRLDLIESLRLERGWVHVAAHGQAQPNRIGYSGIWMSSGAPSDPPDFVSWLDVLAHGSRADLIVLASCELGQSQDPGSASLGFSTALARAGTGEVVAALWPVSDAAAQTWVGSFYTALAAGSDPADALLSARNRLRETRAFRHPFYWSSLVDIAHGY